MTTSREEILPTRPRDHRLLVGLLLVTTPTMADETTNATSFAEAFFISHSVDAFGTRRIEWLGSLVIWTLMATSVASLALIGQLAMTIGGSISHRPSSSSGPPSTSSPAATARPSPCSPNPRRSDFADVLPRPASADGGHEAMTAGLEQAATEIVAHRVRRVEVLNVIGQVSPMLGLFGTVYGMILAFQSIVASGGNADPVLLAGGIGTALVTTFWGLVVAIPALAGYAVLRGRLDSALSEAIGEAEILVEHFRPSPAEQDASSP